MEDFTSENHLEQAPPLTLSPEEASRVMSRFMTQVYGWMAGALAVSGAVAMAVASSATLQELVFGNRFVFLGLIIAEIALVGFLSRKAFDWSAGTTTAAFMGYSALNGLTLGIVFMVYTADSIASTFFITAGTFGVMSLYGYFTRTDLSRWGNVLFMGLIGLLIASVVNIFWLNSVLGLITSFVGVVLFTALTAYDTQKVKMLAFLGHEDEATDRKAAVLGALTLYLDFVNLFLFLLRLFGRRR